jgi:hypothetical protein
MACRPPINPKSNPEHCEYVDNQGGSSTGQDAPYWKGERMITPIATKALQLALIVSCGLVDDILGDADNACAREGFEGDQNTEISTLLYS